MALPPKDVIRIGLDAEQLLSFKKILWENGGLQPQQFFSYIAHRVNLYDERLKPLLEEALKDKQLKAIERGDDKIDADTLYRLIEDGLKQEEKK